MAETIQRSRLEGGYKLIIAIVDQVWAKVSTYVYPKQNNGLYWLVESLRGIVDDMVAYTARLARLGMFVWV